MENNEINMVPILIVVIAVLVLKQLYDFYKKFTKNHHEVYFVMGKSNCCNPYEHSGLQNHCNKKYCTGKLLTKIRNRIIASKSSICIAMYNFSNHLVADYLLSAHRCGVSIRLLIDKSACESSENKTQAKRLKNAGNSFRFKCWRAINRQILAMEMHFL